mgnify:CR=1 FL=1
MTVGKDESMSESTMLAVMGSGGCGKTTLCCKLAGRLAEKRRNVIVVFCDPFTPVIPYILPASTYHTASLGDLLTTPIMKQNNVLTACVPLESTEYISLLGYRMKENLLSFPEIQNEKAAEFFALLRALADCIIIDCTTAFEADAASIVALRSADRILRLGSGNLHGVSYFQSHAALLRDSAYRSAEHLRAVGNVRPGQEWEAVAEQYGGVAYMLPHAPELCRQFDELALFEPLTAKESAAYNAEVQKIAAEVFGVAEEPRGKKAAAQAAAGVPPKKGGFSLNISNPFSKRRGEF